MHKKMILTTCPRNDAKRSSIQNIVPAVQYSKKQLVDQNELYAFES